MNTQTAFYVPRPEGWSPDNDRRWRAVLARILGIEGGHTADTVDRGGETQYGISLRFLKAVGAIDTDHNGFADLDLNMDTVLDGHDVRGLTPEIAGFLYEKHFYIGPGFWNLQRPFDAALFDQAVNGGTTAAVKLLQRALNASSPPGWSRLIEDGGLGAKTRGRLTECLGRGFLVLGALRAVAESRYEAIVAADPTQRKYLGGWRKRAQELGRV